MATVVGPPILDRSLQQALLGFAQPVGAGLAAFGQQRQQEEANQALGRQFGVNIPAGANQQLVNALILQQQDPFGQRAAQAGLAQAQTGLAQGQLGQLGQPKPLDPTVQALNIARTGLAGAQAGQVGQPTLQTPEQRALTEAQTEKALAEAGKPLTGFKVVDQLVDDPQSPTGFSVEQFDQTGKFIGRRNATRKEVLQGVPEGALQKGTQTKIEKDIIDLNSTLAELDVINEQINPDFFTFRGKGAAFFTALGEKLEVPVPQAAKEFLSAKTKFFADSKRVFLIFRKFITGVAGGITEFKEIAKATIDPENDSITEFKSKTKSMEDNVKRTINVLLAMRNSGLDAQNPAVRRQVFRGTSLSNIPIDVPPNITLESLQQTNTRTQAEETRRQELLNKAGQ